MVQVVQLPVAVLLAARPLRVASSSAMTLKKDWNFLIILGLSPFQPLLAVTASFKIRMSANFRTKILNGAG